MTLAEMKAKLEGLKANASAILDKIEAGTATADDEARLSAAKTEIDAVKAQVASLEAVAALRREMAPAAARPALSLGTSEPNPATTAGFKSLAEMAVAVRNAAVGAGMDQRLMGSTPTNVTQGGGGSGEGFLIPSQFRDEIMTAVTATDGILSRFNPQPTAARSIEMVRDETTPWGAVGVQAGWRAEATQMTPSKIVTQASRLEVHDLFAFVAVTEETMEDAPRLESQITLKAAQAIAWKAGQAVLWGDGVGKPLGLMASGALVTVAKESGQANNTIVAANVNKMYSRRLMTQGQRPFWLANSDIFPQLQAMAFGTDTPLFLPPGGITTAPNGMLLGYPIEYSEHAKSLGDLGDLVLIDPTGYAAFQRAGGPRFADSMHLWFDYNLRALRWTFRFGGQPILSAPVSPANGSATKSHFVALAARTA